MSETVSAAPANTSAVSLNSNNQSDAPIRRVVVHPDGAVIHRTWTKPLHPGIHHVRFTNFYQQYYTGSLRIGISGPAAFNEVIETSTLLIDEDRQTRVGNATSGTDAESEAAENSASSVGDSRLGLLHKQKAEHELQLEFLKKRLESWEAYRQLVIGKTQCPPGNIFKEGAFTDLYDFFWKYEGEFIRLRNVIQQTERTLRSVQAAIQRQQTGIGPLFSKVSDIRVVILVADIPDRISPVSLDISYAVREAAWSPKYDLRFADKAVQLSYFGCISQWSGEDWTDVEMAVSSRSYRWSSLNGSLLEPDLPVTVTNVDGQTPNYKTQFVREVVQLPSAENPHNAKASDTIREMAYGDFTVQLPEAVSLSHGKSTLQVSLAKALQLTCEYRYKCEPGRDGHVYRKALISNNSSFILTPGPCSIYTDGQFAEIDCHGGKRLSNDVAPMETINISLGIDESVVVTPKIPVKVTKPLTGVNAASDANFNAEAEFTQEYDVKNTKKLPVSVTFVTTFPTSNNPRFKVTPMHPPVSGRPALPVATKKDSGAAVSYKTNQGKQQVDIPAATTRSIRSIYKMEYPHNIPLQ
ncbi:protein F37C4.5-like [Paramacrobiotus metropolitanus]|uniref:protein F37C4.5-like n=1 Tax=Paramacrobiotus metropolitanus TaxID=2943436 RepID=UPI0024463CF9|nr:protein F37C4.5-like [Paramacrobiotus metropolitanus]